MTAPSHAHSTAVGYIKLFTEQPLLFLIMHRRVSSMKIFASLGAVPAEKQANLFLQGSYFWSRNTKESLGWQRESKHW